MFQPWEVIRAFVSVFFVMLGIPIELYVLGPPKFSLDSEKNKKKIPFFQVIFNGLNGKFQNVIKV